MDVHFLANYPTGDAHGSWSQTHWDGLWFIRAIKSSWSSPDSFLDLSKYRRFEIDRIEAVNAASVYGVFGRWAEDVVEQNFSTDNLAVVPVPSKKARAAHRGTISYPALRLATSIETRMANRARLSDCLRWSRELEPSHRGGPRDPADLYDALLINAPKPRRPTILIDDVVTSGGHLQAVRALLRDQQVDVRGAICAGKSIDANDIDEAFPATCFELHDWVSPYQ